METNFSLASSELHAKVWAIALAFAVIGSVAFSLGMYAGNKECRLIIATERGMQLQCREIGSTAVRYIGEGILTCEKKK
jgi:hypothetical protein